MPILAGGPIGITALPSKKSQQTLQQRYNQSYFSGLRGLSANDRAEWEKQYAREIQGMDDVQKDNLFRNTIFKNIFGNSDNKEDQQIFNNRSSLTKGERDEYVAKKALSSDLDARSALQKSPTSVWSFLFDTDYRSALIDAKVTGGDTMRQQAYSYLENKSAQLYNTYYNQLDALDSETFGRYLKDFEALSGEISPMYKEYNGTDKLSMSTEEKKQALATYLANEAVGGGQFAAEALGKYYQNTVASNQSWLEKTWNSGAQFIDSAAGMVIRAAGMAGGAVGIGLEDDESWLENVIDNAVTRYGDRVATTNSWLPSKQERLESLGLSDNPILNTVEQQNSLFSANTPLELFGQYGFTAASTILSFGSSALQGLTKGAAWLGKVAMGGKTLNATSKGMAFLRGVIKARNIGNVLIPGAVGTVEGGMNAAMTKQETLKGLEADIQNRYAAKVDADIDAYAKQHNMSQEQVDYLKSNPKARVQFEGKYAADIEADKQAARESANTAMYYDFWTNSVINGLVNSTWKAGLEAPRVQNALRKVGLGGGETPVSSAVRAVREGDRWVAQAKQMTKGQVIKGRLKEALGEGFEEYTQDISSAFGQAYAEDKMQQYIDNKYGANPGATASQNDFWQSFAAGIRAAGDTAVSFDAIKSGLYGALSTAMGGPNIGMKQGANGNMTAKGITWRSAFTPLWNNKERDAINQQRERMAEHFNTYFSDESMQRALFNAEGTAEWLTQYQEAIESNDEKAARDARVGQMFSNIITLNDLEGTGYHEAVMANLQARANFNAQNLQDPESEESKAVDQFMASAQNRTQNISREEALQTIQKNANEMLDMMGMVSKETKSIEKIFGENIDQDVKASMVFNKVAIEDYKKRIGQLDEEIAQVTTELNSQEGATPNSALSNKGKRLIARFGSLSNAVTELSKLEEQKSELEQVVREVSEEQKKGTLPQEDQATLAMAESYVRELDKNIKSIKSAQEDYSFNAQHQAVEREGITYNDPVDTTVLSASEIMSLSANDRAFMLDPKHRDRYSQEQQAEIDKVNSVGTSIYQDFTKKIADRNRIERDYRMAMNSQFALMYSPKALNRYVAKVKYQAQQRMLQKKNEELLDIATNGNYWQFSERLDDIYNRGDEAEIAAIEDMLTNQSYKDKWYDFPQEARDMFERYSRENERKAEIYDWAERNGVFEENDPRADVFAATLDYLSNSGVDVTDVEAGAEKLLDYDRAAAEDGEDTPLYFEQHLARANEKAPIEGQVTGYNSIEETIQTYRDIIGRYNSEREQKDLNNEEIIPTETPTEASEPAAIPDPTPAGPTIFDIGGSTPEAGHMTEDGEIVGNPTVSDMVKQGEVETPAAPVETPVETTQPSSVIDTFIENSNEEVGKAAEVALRVAENTPSFTAEAKEQVKTLIEGLSANSFDTVQEFADAITARANALDSRAESNETQVPDLLRHVVAKVLKSQSDKERIDTPSPRVNVPVSPFFDKRRRAIRTQARKMNYQFIVGNPESGMLTSMNIAYLRQSHPDTPIVRYYDKYGIEDALRNEVLTRDSEVMFITDDTLTDEIKSSMESKGLGYTENDLPIIAVVESSTGPITINVNGQDKHFQPVSVMSATGVEYSPGSKNMAPIRRLAAGNTGISLVKNTDGSPIVTKLFKPIVAATSFDSSRKGQENNNVLDVGQNDLSEQEKGTPMGYQKAKRNFLKRLGIVKIGDNRKKLVFQQDKLNGGTQPIDIFTAPVQKTQNRKGQTILQVRDNADELISFNSRTRRAAKTIANFIENFSDEEMSFTRDSNGQVVPLGDTEKLLNSMANTLEGQISNYMNVSSKSEWHYSITATDQVVDGKKVYSIDLVNDNNSIAPIHLTTVHQGMTEEANKAAQHEFLKNLLTDENGEVRMANEKDSFIKWQVPFPEVENAAKGNKEAKDNLSDIYDDGYLEVSPTNVSFNYIIQGIALQNPFKSDGSPVYTTVANPTNASPAAPVNEPVVVPNGQIVRDGTVIDSDTGTVVQGEAAPAINPAAERAKEIVGKIVNDSKSITLADDKSCYIDSKGTRYARVTSIIAADERAGERFDPNSPWVTPSTNIGTGFDEFVRDFFAGKLDNITTSPIATQLWNHLQNIGLSVSGSGEMQKFLRTHNLQSVQQAIESPEVQKEMDEIKKKAVADGTFMKAPNGNPTNLNERQWLQVRTKAFKEWFGDWENNPNEASKVVDENGEPLVVYHGSKSILKAFDPSKSESRQYLSQQIKPTNFFSSDETVADFFALTEEQSLASQISKSISIVLDAFAGEDVDADTLDDEVWTDAARRTGKSKEFVKDFWENKVPREYKMYDEFGTTRMEDPNIKKYKYNVFLNMKSPIILDAKGERADRFIKANKEVLNNNDEVIIININETVGNKDTATDYLVRNPNQIKSATDNVGTFSRTNNDITTYTTPQGEVYGFVDKEGNVYLDETKISPEHPIHEYTHLWDRIVQQKNSKLWNRGVELMKQTTLWNEILNSEHYGKAWQQLGINGERLDNLIASEVHARLTGTEGEALLKKLADKKGQSNIISKLKDWLLDIWKTLGETFGTWNKEDLDNLTLEDFNHLTIRDFTKGYNPVTNTFQDKVSNNVVTELSEKYPNATEESLQKFREELVSLRNNFILNGLTIVPRDVTVTGQIEVADNNDKIHTINVAGTLDLLAYDGKGNFFIFDMKTNHSEINQHKREKYARQLSLYKEFLEKKYGVQVKSLNIIPIGVSYPTPVGWKDGTADYSVSPEKANQLLIDGKEYRGANPTLQDTIAVPYTPLRVVYDRLTPSEKEMLSGIEKTLNEGTGVVEAPVEPVTPIEAQVADSEDMPINSTLGVGVDMSIGDSLFKDDFTGGMSWDIGGRLTPIPHHLQWNNLTQEQRNGLEAKHISEEAWSQMEDQEMEQELGCL